MPVTEATPCPSPPAGARSARLDPASVRAELATHSRAPAVRARVLEFLGGTAGRAPTARYVTTPTTLPGPRVSPASAGQPWAALDRELELARSLWDRDGLLAHLDIEHVHFDRPWETFAHPARAFELQRPVAEAVEARLAAAGLPALHVVTGRGHHWHWRIHRDSEAFAVLSELAPRALRGSTVYRQPQPPDGGVVGEAAGAAFHGLGMVLEGLAHDVLHDVGGGSEIPIQLTAVSVGPGPRGREIVSLDLSAFGDPLSVRTVRVPFTAYLKGWRMGRSASPPLPLAPLVAVAVPAGTPLGVALDARQPERATRLAARTPAVPPDGSSGTLRLAERYHASPLAAFHRWHYATEQVPEPLWPETYDRLDPRGLPRCAGLVLEQPNDRILRPSELQHLVRVLLTLGWHSAHIAGLVRSKLERDHGWQGQAHFSDPGIRADFYVRLFAGLVLAGMDPLVDFNCVSAREKGLCPDVCCGWNLAALRDELRLEELRWATGP